MRILFLPLASPGGAEAAGGVLTRAIPRDLAARVDAASKAAAAFRPFTHMVEGRRVFGVYDRRWDPQDLEGVLTDAPDTAFLVHGDLEPGDPIRITLEVLALPNFEQRAEESFEAPRFDGFRVLEQATRFVLRSTGLATDSPAIEEFPTRTFEAFLHLLAGREAAAALDGWGETDDPAAIFEPFLLALDADRRSSAAEEELCILAMSAVLGGHVAPDVAEGALEKLLEIEKKSWRAWASIGQVRAAAGRSEPAIEALKKALDIDPGRPSLRFDLGMAFLAADRVGRAAKVLETVKSDPALGSSALLALGRIRAQKSDIDGAIALWNAAGEADARNVEAFAELARVHAERGEFEEAQDAFRRGLDAAKTSGDLHLSYGVWLAEQGRTKEAAPHLREALRLLSTAPAAHLNLGRCHADDGARGPALHHLRKALRAEEEIRRKARDVIEGITDPEREERLVKSLEETAERPAEEQLPLLKLLLKEESSFPEARIRLGLAFLSTKKPRKAEGQFRKALKIVPDDPEAWSGLATALRARNKLKPALEAHREAIERAPKHAAFRLNHADTLLRAGLPKEAAAEVDKARALDPHHPLLPNFVLGVKLALSEEAKGKKRS